jgi:nicotinamidase-related amidase
MSTALLIIDVQIAILRGKGEGARQQIVDAALDAMVKRLAMLQIEAREADIPVILVQHDGPEGHRLARGSEGWQIRPELAPRAGELVIHKTASDSFYATDLQQRLMERGIRHLVVGGCMTQFCVDTTARSAVAHGFDVTLVGDGHTTADLGGLGFEQIVAHHNAVLNGFDAGPRTIKVANSHTIQF